MSSVDTAWLRMDRATNLMLIVGVMIFEDSIDFERLKKVIGERFCTYRRFRQRAVVGAMGAYWEDVENFEVDAHVKRVALPGKADKAELQQLVADLTTSPLDPNRPLWQYLLVENYEGGCALITRIHHCIADGVALIGVLLSMTDTTPDGPAHSEATHTALATPTGDPLQPDMLNRLMLPVSNAVARAIKVSGAMQERFWSAFTDPQRAIKQARTGATVVSELAELALMADDSPTRLKGKPGSVKRVAWSEPMRLDEVKAVGKALGCSLNDVLLSTAAGAFGGYLEQRGDDIEGVEIRALVPVNLREAGRGPTLGNRFGMVALVLPVGIKDPFERLAEISRRMDERKDSLQAPVTLGLLGAVGMAPKAIQDLILDVLAAKATAVMTNVPGPQTQLYLAGAKLEEQMFWVPQSGDIGIGVSILSYNNCVQFGLITDRGLLPDPESVVAQFRPEFERLLSSKQPVQAPQARKAPKTGEMTAAKRTRRPPGTAGQGSPKPVRGAVAGDTPPKVKTTEASASPAAANARIPKRFR